MLIRKNDPAVICVAQILIKILEGIHDQKHEMDKDWLKGAIYELRNIVSFEQILEPGFKIP